MQPLEELISNWRQSLAPSADPEIVEEFEEHLREAIARHQREGRPDAEAFHLAVQQFGSPEQIAQEFQKIEWGAWWAVKVAASLGGALLLLASAVAFIAFSDRQFGWWLATHVAAVSAGYSGVFLTGALGIAYVIERCRGEFTGRRLRVAARATANFAAIAAALNAIGLVLAMIWAKLAWGRFWAWDPKETGAFGILVWLVLFSAAARTGLLPARATMLLAIFGNVIVSIGWFGAHLAMLDSHARSYGLLITAILFHLFFLAVGFLPSGCLSSRRDRPSHLQ